MLTWPVVAARILANPASNVFQKQLARDRVRPLLVVAATHALLALPSVALLALVGVSPIRGGFALPMTAAAALAVVGNATLVRALEAGDLSVLGPINAFKALLSTALGIVILGEHPGARGVAGMCLIVAGSYFMVERSADQSRRAAMSGFAGDRAVQLRLAALVLSATEAVFLKRAIAEASPAMVFAAWSILGGAIAAALAAWDAREDVGRALRECRPHRSTLLWLAFTTGVMQGATLLTFNAMQVGYALALFQLSGLLSVFLGYRYFRERNIGRRLTGAAFMVAGAALIVAFGRGT